ncbi:MAG: DUF3987 domain-containing protein, partial [Caulobacteraceae bacterium]|nr:DUF3987 domain-containing protein [Caulobacteraceae bacterium]
MITLTQHLERQIATLFSQLLQKTMKTWQSTKPILLKSLDNIKHNLEHTKNTMMHKPLNQTQQKQLQEQNKMADDDDEPIGPRRMADDERPEDAQLTTAATSYAPTPQTQLSAEDQKNVELRKIALEEMKFHLEERRELHKMMVEDRREQQKEDEKAAKGNKPEKISIKITGGNLEGVLKRLEATPKGMAIINDELAGFFNALNMYRKGDD